VLSPARTTSTIAASRPATGRGDRPAQRSVPSSTETEGCSRTGTCGATRSSRAHHSVSCRSAQGSKCTLALSTSAPPVTTSPPAACVRLAHATGPKNPMVSFFAQ
jgi:hypothetical protein